MRHAPNQIYSSATQTRAVKINNLKMKLPTMEKQSATRLAESVAKKLAAGVSELCEVHTEVKTRVSANSAMSHDDLASRIASQILHDLSQSTGKRKN